MSVIFYFALIPLCFALFYVFIEYSVARKIILGCAFLIGVIVFGYAIYDGVTKTPQQREEDDRRRRHIETMSYRESEYSKTQRIEELEEKLNNIYELAQRGRAEAEDAEWSNYSDMGYSLEECESLFQAIAEEAECY